MTLTEEQSGFLSILRETGFIRRDQVLPPLRLHTPKKTAEQAEGLLRRLAYLGRLGCWHWISCWPWPRRSCSRCPRPGPTPCAFCWNGRTGGWTISR